MPRGTLRIYLGAAPGVGKTYAMLSEGRRRAARGTDVVVGVVEDHGRPRTREALGDLPVLPRRVLTHCGVEHTELDLEALLARHPQVALVDELAHSNVPGSRHAERWQDVEDLLAAGIDVVSTVDVQQLASLSDVVRTVTGVPQRETVPDAFVRSAEQVDLVDMSPEALRRRLAHGNVYAAERVDAALGSSFRLGTLTALRELALLWLADKVEEGLQAYRLAHGVVATWETRERVVVALTGGAEGDTLVRRAARIASRQSGGDLLAVHVARSDGLPGASPGTLAAQRALVESLGGSFHVVVGDRVPAALLDFARTRDATQLVLGASRRGRFRALLGPGTSGTVVRDSGSIDVHLVTHEQVARGTVLPGLTGGLTLRRRLTGTALGVVLLTGLTVLLTSTRGTLSTSSQVLLYLTSVIAVALVGGLYPALAAAVAAVLLLNYFFTAPLHTLAIDRAENVLGLSVFVLVAVAVSTVVDLAARRTRQAARARAEAETLAVLSGDVLRGERTLPALLGRARELFGLDEVRLLEQVDGADLVVGTSGVARPGTAVTTVPVADGVRLELRGAPVAAEDLRVLGAFAAQAAVSVERGRLRAQASAAAELSQVDRVRTSLLAAVGHDLHTPLAAAKASVGSLRSGDIAWSPEQTAELLATAEESLDQLADVVGNLLDMSRLQAGVLGVHLQRAALGDLLPGAVVAALGDQLVVDLPPDVPDVLADPGLLERVLANLLQNAARHAPGAPVRLAASALGDRVEVRVVDRGPGVSDAQKERVFEAFQRLDDRASSSHGPGVGLGLAVARGFVDAMGGTLTPEDTPGGGLTMTVSLAAAP
jgi:two-component system sensor histidine kinase KdpD